MASKKVRAQRGEYGIVVGIDLTPAAAKALTAAVDIARARPNARIHVVHAMDNGGTARSARAIVTLDHQFERAAKALRAYIERWVDDPAATARIVVHVRRAAPADAIVQVAVDVDAEIVVVGTAARTGITRLTHSSVSAKVLKSAPCAVLLARPKTSGKPKTPRIEPACSACRSKRAATGGRVWWCDDHLKRASTRAHVYSYSGGQGFASRGAAGGH
jgi:nucleotide-binding universal stress UspA family protein